MAWFRKKLDPEIKARWVAGLRSGKYPQGHGALREWNVVAGHYCYCPLGVLIEVEGGMSREMWEELGFTFVAPPIVDNLSRRTAIQIATFNDDRGWTFGAIADYIERHL